MALYVYKCDTCNKVVEQIRNYKNRNRPCEEQVRHTNMGCIGKLERDPYPGSNWRFADVLLAGKYRAHEDGLDGNS